MRTTAHDWLDLLARRAAKGRRTARVTEATQTASGVPGPAPERFSRARAVRLAIAGAASLLVAGGRVSPALALTRDECLGQCFDKYVKAADRDVEACKSLYRDPKSSFRTDTSRDPHGWGRLWYRIKRGGWKFVEDAASEALYQACERKAVSAMERGFERCEDACRETCPEVGGRGPNSLTGGGSCRGTSPPRASKPHPPPAPNPANDPCAPCAQVGGACCGACPSDPTAHPCLTILTTGETANDCKDACP